MNVYLLLIATLCWQSTSAAPTPDEYHRHSQPFVPPQVGSFRASVPVQQAISSGVSTVQASLPGAQYSYQLFGNGEAADGSQQPLPIILKSSLQGGSYGGAAAASAAPANVAGQQAYYSSSSQQGSDSSSTSSGGSYQGVQVTKEETEKLHAAAIEAQRKLIEQQQALIAAGPAKGGSSSQGYYEHQQYQQVQQSRPIIQTFQQPVANHQQTLYVQQPASHIVSQQNYGSAISTGSLVAGGATSSSQQLGASSLTSSTNNGEYKGPKVTKEETEKLHAGPLAELQRLIALQDSINKAGPAKAQLNIGSQVGSSQQVSSVGQNVIVQQQQQVTRPSGSYGVPATSGHYTASSSSGQQQSSGSQQSAASSSSASTASASLGSNNQQQVLVRPSIVVQPTIHYQQGPAVATSQQLLSQQHQSSSAAQQQSVASSAASQQQQVIAGSSQQQQGATVYDGPKVTKEETEKLHASAILEQKKLIAAQEAINAAGPATANVASTNSQTTVQQHSSSTGASNVNLGNIVAQHFQQQQQQQPHRQLIGFILRPVQQGASTSNFVQQQHVLTSPSAASSLTTSGTSAQIAGSQSLASSQEQHSSSSSSQTSSQTNSQSSGSAATLGASHLGSHSSSQQSSAAQTSVPVGNTLVTVNEQQSVYTGPQVSKEETERLHASAIKQRDELVVQLNTLISGGSSTAGVGTSGVQASLDEDSQAEQALLAAQEAEVQRQTQLAIQQGELAAALQDGQASSSSASSGGSSSSGKFVSSGQTSSADTQQQLASTGSQQSASFHASNDVNSQQGALSTFYLPPSPSSVVSDASPAGFQQSAGTGTSSLAFQSGSSGAIQGLDASFAQNGGLISSTGSNGQLIGFRLIGQGPSPLLTFMRFPVNGGNPAGGFPILLRSAVGQNGFSFADQQQLGSTNGVAGSFLVNQPAFTSAAIGINGGSSVTSDNNGAEDDESLAEQEAELRRQEEEVRQQTLEAIADGQRAADDGAAAQ